MNTKINKKRSKKAICLTSGGLDSTVVAGIAKKEGYELYCLFFNYGQKSYLHELNAVKYITSFLKCEKLLMIDLPYIKKFGGSAMLDPKTPLNEKNFIKEYVPFRNSQFLAIATAWAEVIGAEKVFIGSTGGDHVCPDNSKKYTAAFQRLVDEGTMLNKNIKIEAPLQNTDKTGALKIGIKLKIPFYRTWSCHNNFKKHCGHCTNCRDRMRAYKENNIKKEV